MKIEHIISVSPEVGKLFDALYLRLDRIYDLLLQQNKTISQDDIKPRERATYRPRHKGFKNEQAIFALAGWPYQDVRFLRQVCNQVGTNLMKDGSHYYVIEKDIPRVLDVLKKLKPKEA